MAMYINTNSTALSSQNALSSANSSLTKSIQRLSTGLRINSASDDASGLAIADKMRAQINGFSKASLNAQDAVSYLQTAEGAMGTISDMVQRMRELAVQAGNGTYTASDRAELQKEVDQLKEEVNRISSATEFNTKKLLNGNASALTSTSSNDITAIVRGTAAEGNYRLDFNVEGGQSAVYKTNILSYAEDTLTLKDNDAGSTTVNSLSYTGDLDQLDGLTVNVDQSTGTTASTTSTATLVDSYEDAASAGSLASSTLTVNSGLTNSGYLAVEVSNDTTIDFTNGGTADFKVTFIDADGNATIQSVTATIAAGDTDITLDLGALGNITLAGYADGDAATAGDKALFAVTGNLDGGGTAITLEDSAGATVSPTFEMAATDKNASVSYVTLSDSGDLNVSSVSLNFGTAGAADGSFELDVKAAGTAATGDTKLSDLAQFINADGVSVLANTQELTIYGNNGNTTITLEGNDTIDDLVTKMNNALNELGMTGSVTYNPNAGSGDNAVAGTIVYQSGSLVGDQSEIKLVGTEDVINALGVSTIQEAENADLTVTVTNAHTGATVGKDTVSDYMLRGVISGIDVKVSSSVKSGDSAYLHVKSNATQVQVGANEGQTIDVSIAQMDTTSLEIDDANVMTMEDSQKAITKFDQALTKITSARATIGAQINRLEYTMDYLATAKENMTAAESRIRDLDVAEETTNYTQNQVLVNSAVAMLAQANTLPQTALQLIGG